MEAAAEGCGNGLQRRDKVKDSRALFQPLPLGEVSPKVTERARTLTGNRRHGDSIALTKSLLIVVYEFCRTGLALSGASRQLPQRGSLLRRGSTLRGTEL